tara:strand:+ start:153 stop:476 length:324 start_codon:yes stop_codon:yes gene_type:complete
MPDYGKTLKQICFDSNDHLHANLKLRLHYDGLKIKEFFNEIIKAYVSKNEHFINFIEELKEQKEISKTKRNKTKRAYTKAKKVEKEFGLNESEIENIFDIIEKEWGV